MPEKIIVDLGDGKTEEREYFTAEDLAQKVGETKAEFESRIQELEERPASKNFRALEDKAKSWEAKAKALESQGKELNDKGEIVDLNPKISYEDIENRARAAARDEQLNFRKEEFLSQYDEETRKVVEHNYNKLTAGEQITIANMGQFIDQAEMLSIPNRGNVVRNAVTASRGTVPNKAEPVNFAETEAGKGLAEEMGLRYATK